MKQLKVLLSKKPQYVISIVSKTQLTVDESIVN